eukprot:1466988-Pyramimonas_sp.AAC.1
MAMLTRVWSLAREEDVRSWTSSSEQVRDAVTRRNSALREAFARALQDEARVRMGIDVGASLIAAKAFYDLTSREALVDA